MTLPRQVLPGQFYMLTRSCTQRQFLLRPDEETNNAFIYCLIEAAQRFHICILLPIAMSNHHHTDLYDRYGNISLFAEHFHKMLAKCMNARWGRWENFWAAEEVCITQLCGREAVIDELVYAAINPVKDFLVERSVQWPGVNGYVNLLNGKPLRARRPRHYFSEHGVMPETVEMSLVIPRELGEHDAVVAEVRARVEEFEREKFEQRMKSGRRILGRRAVLEQSWKSAPKTFAPKRRLRPRFAGRTEHRVPALLAYKAFQAMYRDALLAWRQGATAVFPMGTYWLARFAPIAVAALASSSLS
jgi:putative transposase